MNSKYFIVLSLLLLFCSGSNAVTGNGVVTDIVFYSSGNVLIKGINFGSESGCQNNSGFFLSSEHPSFQGLFSLILSAKAMKTELAVVADTPQGCSFPIFTTSNQYLAITAK